MARKGIVLAGGTGTRLYPLTFAVTKQLLPVYDKPMIYYPISVLMLAGIKEILIICTSSDRPLFQKLLGDGRRFGVCFDYMVQAAPEGLAQAFVLGAEFIGNDNVCLVLGDNIFHGQHFSEKLLKATGKDTGATVFGYPVNDPERFGVVELNSAGDPISVQEKPLAPRSNYAVTGLYFYDNRVIEIAKEVRPSERGELEITPINRAYLEQNALEVERLGRGFVWLDTGTHDSLLEAGQYVQTVEKQQGLKLACLEEIAWRNGWISDQELAERARQLRKTGYGYYLSSLLN
ncbi:glucose-1-phosphate thymidylyltransferase RfbA [Carnimonas bestiolae]|uniref:glucose-1-phosphate thymidylyltransferase RfbA n=1 Tax=Carnimonas bestiolae TaxID=3402172 RepID=UPI003EDBF562